MRRRLLAVLAVLAALLGACGGDDDGGATGGDEREDGEASIDFVAQVASYELVAGRPQRFLTGITGRGTGTVVSFGTVDLEFYYVGTREQPVDPPQKKAEATATFVPIAGRDASASASSAAESGPKEVRPSEGLGVYEATGVTFDAAGSWGVRVHAVVDGEKVEATSGFVVRAEPRVPAAGMPAPRTENPTIATLGDHAKALDSRASPAKAVPDPEMHATTVAAALAAGRPVVVVVSTPVYCVSQFCGPITDRAQALAKTYGDRVAFVHLEVWEDFEAKKVNAAAREWVQPGGVGDLNEPWVFLVGGDGIVRQRFDNVVSDAQFEAAVKELAGQ